MVEKCGAEFEKMNISKCTHLITTPGCYHSEEAPSKISEAQKKSNCDIVSIDWLLASVKQKKPLNTKGFLISALGGKRLVSTSTSTTPKSSPKRKLSSDESDDHSRRTKSTTARVLANLGKLSAMVDKASQTNDTKNLAVWINDSDRIWDATLVETISTLNNPTNPKMTSAKIIRIQLVVDIQTNKYDTCIRETTLTRQHPQGPSNPTCVTRTVDSKGDGHLSRAITEFETAFERLTGLTWSARLARPKESKAIFIPFENRDAQIKVGSTVADVLCNL
ncbi:hypothetical protein PENSUB_5419 [Penicillium subrubescens]|uniref:BRCT domain-containing protein n=1 Tax=Penicillium subrubescens TaxID=1316194 RepID=A0A1Q5U9R8_9EURO|nr:hypothetical protein PENSUB_5419 [Penicillium subrubescens]